MAFVTRFFELEPSSNKRAHSESQCSWRIAERDGEPVVQLDTYGSAMRKDVGTISQSLQLDRPAAAELVRILEDAFPGLRSSG